MKPAMNKPTTKTRTENRLLDVMIFTPGGGASSVVRIDFWSNGHAFSIFLRAPGATTLSTGGSA